MDTMEMLLIVGIPAFLFVALIVRDGLKDSESQHNDPVIDASTAVKPDADEPLFNASWNSPRRMLQIVVIAFFASFLMLASADHPRWNWANCIGGALATVTISVMASSLFVGLRMLYSDYRPYNSSNKFLSFLGALAIPILVVAPALSVYNYNSAIRGAEETREFDRTRNSMNN